MAVLAVVVHHTASLAGGDRSGVLAGPAAVLDVGVALFFVLSGYLIYRPFAARHATGSTSGAVAPYLWRRALRVLPAYWLALGTFLVLGIVRPASFGDLVSHVLLLNVFRPSALFDGISQGWSLTAEVCFYLLVPLWSWLLRRRGATVTLRTELVGIGALVALAHAFRVGVHLVDWHVGPAELRGISYLWLPTHLDTLAAGMALAVVAVHRGATLPTGLRPLPWWLGAGGLLGLYGVVWGGPSVASGYGLGHLEVRQVVYTLIGLAVVGPLVVRAEAAAAGATNPRPDPRRDPRRAAPGRLLWWSGALSYGVYLFHNDLMELVTREAGAARAPGWLGDGLGDMAFPPLLAVGLVGGLAAAFVSWSAVERPSQRLRSWVGDGVPFWSHLSPRGRDRAAWAIVAAVLLLPVWGLLRYQGPPMEEGFMLAFPEQLLAGRLPHRDFLHLYGPGSLWVLAGLYEVFGTSLALERLVGLAQHAAVAAGLFSLIRPWGRRAAVVASSVSILILVSPLGLSAMAWNGALAFAVVGLALGSAAARTEDDRRARRLLVGAGVCAGAALLYRPDLVVAAALGFGALWWRLDRHRRGPLVLAAVATSLLYVPHLLTSGIEASFRGMFLEPVFELRAGRALPVPPSFGEVDGFLQRAGAIRVVGWPLPMLPTSVQIHLWFWLVPLSAALVVGAWWWARRAATPRAAHLGPPALFAAALFTQAFQRPDTAHLSWVTGITFPIAVGAVLEVLPLVRERWGRPRRGTLVWAAAPLAVVLVAVIPFYPARTYVDLVTQTFGFNRFGFEIRRGDRVFYYGSEEAAASAQRVVDRLAERSRPGERLVVGPVDLSKTPYSDAFFYFLFPELPPGTRYIEMDPGIADAPDSGLADELRRSDWLIRSDAWSGWDEPNDSRLAGSTEPNEVVAERYCTELDAGTFQLLRRCDR